MMAGYRRPSMRLCFVPRKAEAGRSVDVRHRDQEQETWIPISWTFRPTFLDGIAVNQFMERFDNGIDHQQDRRDCQVQNPVR